MRVTYNTNLSVTARLDLEGEIQGLLYEKVPELDEDDAEDVAKQVLALVVSKLRPDLCLTTTE